MPTILFKNGRVFTGERFLSADVLVADGKVQAIEPDLTEAKALTFDIGGKTLLPGLVDIHMHIAGVSPSQWGAPAQAACFPFGVTAAADCSGALGGRTVLENLGIDAVTFAVAGTRDDTAHVENTAKILDHYGPHAAGVKVCYDIHDDPTLCSARPLAQICEFAHSRGLQVTVHTTGTPIPMAALLATLGPGDIATHVYHGTKHNLRQSGYACIGQAKNRGVIVDTGFGGSSHVDFSIFAEAVAAGAAPDTLSTDLIRQILCARGGRYGMTMCMSMARTVGMTEEDVFRAVTANPAKALRKPWGKLQAGGPADLCVLSWGNEPWSLTDQNGNQIGSAEGYRCHMTLKNGTIVHRNA